MLTRCDLGKSDRSMTLSQSRCERKLPCYDNYSVRGLALS